MAERNNSQVLQKSDKRSIFRWLGISLLVGIGCIALALYAAVHWIEKNVLNTENWVALVAPLPKDPEVSKALGTKIADTLFTNVDIEQEVTNALPPRAAFLADPLTNELRTVTTRTTQRVVASDAFQDVWSAANRIAMNRLLATAHGQQSNLKSEVNQKFNINLDAVKGELNSRLGNTADVLPSLNTRNGQQIALDINLKARQERIRQYVRAVDFLAAVLPFLAATCFLVVLAMSLRRRQALMLIVGITAGLLLVELVVLKVLRQQVLDGVQNASYQSAVGVAYDTIVSSLQQTIYIGLIILAVIFIGCLLSGPAAWAVKMRGFIQADRLRKSRPVEWWHAIRVWTNQYKYYLWIGIVLLLLLYLAFAATINWRTGINSLLAAIGVGAIIYIIATPRLAIARYTS